MKRIFSNLIFILLFSLCWSLVVQAKPASCKNVNLDRFMHTGQVDAAIPEKIYRFNDIRAELLRSFDTGVNTQCYVDFYKSSLSEVGDYWGSRLAQAGCQVSAAGEITGTCPEGDEARKSVQYFKNLDREVRTKISKRLAESREARDQARAVANNGECATSRNAPEKSLEATKDVMCCGTENNSAGVVRAVLPGTNYNSCVGKIRPTTQQFFSGSGLADCLGNAVKAAAQMLWDSLSSIIKLPGELWAARTQIWQLLTSQKARAEFASALMQQFKNFFEEQSTAFNMCFNDYEKAQYVCRVGGQIIATAALPQTIGAFLGLATKPVGAAARAITQILQKSPNGSSILGNMSKANEAAARGLQAATSAAKKAGATVDNLTGGAAGATVRGTAAATKAVGRPISILAEKLAASIENSATFQRMFVNSFRAEKTAMGSAPSTALARAQVLEGEVLPPAPRAAAQPSNAARIANDNVIEGEFRVIDDGRGAGSGAARIEGDTGTPRLPAPDSSDVPRLPAPDSTDVPRLPAPDSPAPAGTSTGGSSRALSDTEVDDFVGRMSGRNNLRAQDLDTAGSLSDAQRVRAAQGILERDITPDQSDALLRAHNVGSERGFGRYTEQDIEQKREILRSAGYSQRETETLLWKGVAGSNNPYLDVGANRTNLTRFMGGREPSPAQVEAVIKTHTMRERSVDDRIKVLTDAGFNPGMAREIATNEHHRVGGRSSHLTSPATSPSSYGSPRPSTATTASSTAARPTPSVSSSTPPSARTSPQATSSSTAAPARSTAAAPNEPAPAATTAPPPAAPANPLQVQRQAAAQYFGDRDPIVRAGDLSQLNTTTARKTLDEMVLKYDNRTRLTDEARANHALQTFQEDVSQIYKLKSRLADQKPGSPEAIQTEKVLRAYQHRCRAWSTLYKAAGYSNDSTIRLFERDIARVCNN